MKFDDFEINLTPSRFVRVNRNVNLVVFKNSNVPIFNEYESNKNGSIKENDFLKEKKDFTIKHTHNLRLDVLGSHNLKFNFDKEFNLFLPSSYISDEYINILEFYSDDSVVKPFNNLQIITDSSLIHDTLKDSLKPNYFNENVVPFLERKPTRFNVPNQNVASNSFLNLFKSSSNNKPNYFKFDRFVGREWLEDVAKDLPHGAFIYVGCKEEVYLLSLAKNLDDSLHMQGTYVTSAKPPLWFSNNYLGTLSVFDATRPLFKGGMYCNVAKYRTSNPPSFDGSPFIFQAIGRSQDCKNSIFTGEPDIITSSLVEALSHFRKTDFYEFEDVVKSYAININKKTHGVKPNGKYFY